MFPVAHQWADLLTDEFANQGAMEKELDIPSALFGGPPTVGDLIKLGKSQQGFMGVFARPLFEAVTGILPAMSFSIDELEKNKEIWAKKIANEKSSQPLKYENSENHDASTSQDSLTESSQTIEKSTPHTSADAAELRSSSIPDSPPGKVSLSPTTITSTALPLQQVADGMFPKKPSASNRGRAASGNPDNLTSQSDPTLLQRAVASLPDKQRAVSAHHGPRKLTQHSDPMPNGLNSNFAASETDVRYFGNGVATISAKGGKKEMYLHENAGESNHNERKEKRLTQSFKRLFKKRWRSTATTSYPKMEAQNSPSLAGRSTTPVTSQGPS